MRLLVIGAGAIGCLVGGKLALAGEEVTLVGRPRFAETVAAHGLRLQSDGVDTVAPIARAVGSMAAAFAPDAAPYDLAILTVKSYDTAAALDEFTAAAGANLPPVLSLQNGVGNEEAIAAVCGEDRVLAGTLTTPVSVLAPGHIRIDRPSFTLGVSAWSPQSQPGILGTIHTALVRAGFKARSYPHARGMKWTKLLMNMMGNATSAILDAPPAQLFQDGRVVDIEIAAWREALAVMAAAGVPPVNLGSYPFAWLAPLIRAAPAGLLRPILRRQVAGARGDKLPSLHIDLHQGKAESEINWLNGAVVTLGARVHVATPVNALLTTTIHRLLQQPDQRDSWRGNVAQLAALALGTGPAHRT